MKKLVMFLFILAVGFGALAATNTVNSVRQRAIIADSLDVAPVWAGHPVGFALLTHAPDQFVAFYDDHRQLTVVQRRLPAFWNSPWSGASGKRRTAYTELQPH